MSRCIICNYCPETDGFSTSKGFLIWDDVLDGYICEECRSHIFTNDDEIPEDENYAVDSGFDD